MTLGSMKAWKKPIASASTGAAAAPLLTLAASAFWEASVIMLCRDSEYKQDKIILPLEAFMYGKDRQIRNQLLTRKNKVHLPDIGKGKTAIHIAVNGRVSLTLPPPVYWARP